MGRPALETSRRRTFKNYSAIRPSRTRRLCRVKRRYPWVDVMVGDGLYANGPFLTLLKELKMGAVLHRQKRGRRAPQRGALHLG